MGVFSIIVVLELVLTHSTRRATIVARAQSSHNSEGHYSGRGNVINVSFLKINSELGVSTHAQYPERNELKKHQQLLEDDYEDFESLDNVEKSSCAR